MHSRSSVRLRALAMTATATAACLVATSCSGDFADGGSGGQKVTLRIGVSGSFGFEEAGLYTEYMKAHPNIVIQQTNTRNEGRYWRDLRTRLDSGSRPADIQSLSAERMAEVVHSRAGSFTDLGKTGLGGADQGLAPWKTAAATTADGRVLAAGTDSEPEAICYRTDLLRAAGLPTRRDRLAAAWSTWDGYLALAKKYAAKAKPGRTWTDSATALFTAELGQQRVRYTDESGAAVYAKNPAVRTAWKHAARLVGGGLSANLRQNSAAWDKALTSDRFATVVCPAGMLRRIEAKAGDRYAGTWDVAAGPGRSGNLGGSYLAIPKSAKHPKEAAALLKWLTADQQQVRVFTRSGLFPSGLRAQAQIRLTQDPYFNNAPVGEIFGQASARTPVQSAGADETPAHQAFADALAALEGHKTSAEKGWRRALADADRAMKRQP